jgi:hypothetical protein
MLIIGIDAVAPNSGDGKDGVSRKLNSPSTDSWYRNHPGRAGHRNGPVSDKLTGPDYNLGQRHHNAGKSYATEIVCVQAN